MSLNKGKAKVKAKSKSIAKGAGKNKSAVLNSRSPKDRMIISGDTMSNYAMYKAGGTTKAQKFAALAPPYDKITAADRIAGAKKNARKK